MATHSSTLAWKIPGMEELGKLQSMESQSWTLPYFHFHFVIDSDQIRSVIQSFPTLCDPMNRSMPGLPVHHQLPEFTQTHFHRVSVS